MAAKSIKVLSLGQTVYIGPKSGKTIEGEITSVCISAQSITYEVLWWRNDEPKKAWFGENKMKFKAHKRYDALGFFPENK